MDIAARIVRYADGQKVFPDGQIEARRASRVYEMLEIQAIQRRFDLTCLLGQGSLNAAALTGHTPVHDALGRSSRYDAMGGDRTGLFACGNFAYRREVRQYRLGATAIAFRRPRLQFGKARRDDQRQQDGQRQCSADPGQGQKRHHGLTKRPWPSSASIQPAHDGSPSQRPAPALTAADV